jgi:AsmA protein
MRALKIAGAAIAAVIVIAGLLLIIGVPSGFMTSAIQARVERETGYRLSIAGSTRIGMWPSLNVTMHDVTLQDPKDREGSNRLTAGSIQADITLASVWSGRPQITELVVVRPVLYVPLLRERTGPSNAVVRPATSSGAAEANTPIIERITITDGTVAFSNLRDRVDSRIDGINADATIGGDRSVKVTGNARGGDRPLKFEIKAIAPAPPIERQNIPVDVTLDAPGLLQAPLSAKAEVRLNGPAVMINGLTGALGDGAFNGWASVDLSSKPLVKLDLDFQRLDLAVSKNAVAGSQGSLGSQPWSNALIDLTGLNYVDAQAKVSAAEINIGEARFAPAAIDASLAGGVLKTRFSNLGAYGGQASGDVIVDAASGDPVYSLRSDLVGVRALPLLKSAADFDKLDGRMQAKIGVRSTGTSQRAIMTNLAGTVFANFQDGAIKGLNVAQMIRSLTASPLSGWQEGREQNTDLTQLSASFRIEKGQATTSDLNLVGPLVKMTGAGTVDLGAKALAFRVEPKLVMTTEGQGRAADPVGLGIPVVIDGPWAEPRIYPDMAGILDNPDAAYAKLKEMGKGLFGPGGGGLGGLGGLGGSSGLGSGLGGLSGLGGWGGNAPAGSAAGGNPSDQLGGNLGETIGKLLQQGLAQGPGQGQGQGQGTGQGRNIPARKPPIQIPSTSTPDPTPTPTPAPSPTLSSSSGGPATSSRPDERDPSQPPAPESQPMNDLLRQLFNR